MITIGDAPVVSTGPALRPTLDFGEVARSVGGVAYRWDLATDALEWSANASEALQIGDIAAIASGRRYGQMLDNDVSNSRQAAILNSALRDAGTGVAYQVRYAIRPSEAANPLWIEDNGRWFAGPDGRPAFAHGMIRQVCDTGPPAQLVSVCSGNDDLTGELGRQSLIEALSASFEAAQKLRDSLGFLIVSVDDLARINEAYGFAVGDEVIAACAKRLNPRMRSDDRLGRLCGNKFGIILKQCQTADLIAAADRFLTSIREEVIETTAGPVAVTASAGGVIAPRHAATVSEVLARAHEALISTRDKHRGAMEVFRRDPARDALRRENMRVADEIVAAINDGRIVVAFEPVAEIRSRRAAFHECLMRIRRADGTLVLASDIMPVAERLGLVRLVDHRMLELIVAEMTAAPGLRLSFNVSTLSMSDAGWSSALLACLAGNPAIARRLIVEITESTAIENIEQACAFIAPIKDLGCKVAIDDFGAGCTSFRNMRKLGVDLVKIDGSFIRNLTTSADDQAFVRTLIALAKQVGLLTVAEWVQDEESAVLLSAWGCDYLQGTLIGPAAATPVADGSYQETA